MWPQVNICYFLITLFSFTFLTEVKLTAWTVPIACGSLTGSVLAYSFIGSKIKKADKPHYIYIVSWGFALLDVASDYNMAFELYVADDPTWPIVFGLIMISVIIGSMYFS